MMSSIETLNLINAEFQSQLRKVANLSLTQWTALADSLGVSRNDREHAAKKLALRTLRADGKIS
jgi:hypothetical protein